LRWSERFSQNIAAFLHGDEVIRIEEQDWLIACEVDCASGEAARQGVVANTLNLYRNGAVGFID
jgi:hypothetical protein